MTELNIELKELSLQDFYGQNNENLKTIRSYFPKLKIVGRDYNLSAQGNEEILETFEQKISKILEFLKHYNRLNAKDIEGLMIADGIETDLSEQMIVHGLSGKLIKAQTPNQKKIVQLIQKNDLVFVVGPAGTGKTYTSIALAVKALKEKRVKRIVLTRPAVEAGERIGFLPGDMKEKLDPYMQPLYDALRDMFSQEKLNSYMEKRIIEIAPLAFMRGRTLDNSFVILDEAQNTTIHQMKMFLTRMGKNAKFMITGDPGQKDLEGNNPSGLKHAVNLLQNTQGIGIVRLNEADVLRHELVGRIIKAYRGEISE